MKPAGRRGTTAGDPDQATARSEGRGYSQIGSVQQTLLRPGLTPPDLVVPPAARLLLRMGEPGLRHIASPVLRCRIDRAGNMSARAENEMNDSTE